LNTSLIHKKLIMDKKKNRGETEGSGVQLIAAQGVEGESINETKVYWRRGDRASLDRIIIAMEGKGLHPTGRHGWEKGIQKSRGKAFERGKAGSIVA